MSGPRSLCFYLDPDLRESAAAGRHNFLNKIAEVGRAAGLEVRFDDAANAVRSDSSREYAVVHMEPPPHENAVSVRRAYFYPFWSIERTEKRWEFDVAKAAFDPGSVPASEAAAFVRRWRKKWFADRAPGPSGHVYVPLQGRLLDRRSFQSCSPLEMIETVLAHDPARKVMAGLHPKETYTDSELAALDRLEASHDRLSVQMGGADTLLPGCDYVVTQNSAVGFSGYFLGKPLVLFGQIDFHHIALKAAEMGAADVIRAAPGHRPEFDAYLWWFLQHMAINAGRPEADERIAARLRGFGWPV